MTTPIVRSALRPFIKARVGGELDPSVDKALTELQDSVEVSVNSIISHQSLDNLHHIGVNIPSGTVFNFNHQLGRRLIGWHITGKSGFGDVMDQQATNATPDKTLQLLANATMSLNILVF